MKPVFDREKLEKLDKILKTQANKYRFTIGADMYTDNSYAYCLSRISDKYVAELILLKTMRNLEEFKEEVSNIAKYFNANIYCDEPEVFKSVNDLIDEHKRQKTK